MSTVNMLDIKHLKEPILKIRFPFFKKITPNSFIDFETALTVLVGPNGSGKTSVLQALYGCPNRSSVGDFWFSTSIDPLDSTTGDIHRFIYQYKPKGLNKSIEILKNRTLAKSKRTNIYNPDYWETAKPKISDGMARMPPLTKKDEPYRNSTRWKAVEKEVIYIDFRAEISAFDKCFYFGDYTKSKTIDTIQDFIRFRSSALKPGIDQGKKISWHGRTITQIKKLSEAQTESINKILTKTYSSTTVITHNFFGSLSNTIIFEETGKTYSEAVAGSGEVAIVNCVIKVSEAPKGSLILLDEPEVSLHPGAQTELRELLLDKIKCDQCQVVISTHSQSFVDGMPSNAIKLFYRDKTSNTYSILNQSTPEQAFVRLGIKNKNKFTIFVEDKLAKLITEFALSEIDDQIAKKYNVIESPGGAKTIIKHHSINYALSNEHDSLVLLDGDEKPNATPIKSSQLSKDDETNIDKILEEQTGVKASSYQLPVNGGNAKQSIKEAEELVIKKKILDAFHKYFRFMNFETPEELIWEISKHPQLLGIKDQVNQQSYKNKFKKLTQDILVEVNSQSIFSMQKAAFSKRDTQHPVWLDFKRMLKEVLAITEHQD